MPDECAREMDSIGNFRGISPRRRRAWEGDLSREHDAKRMLMLSRQLFEQRGALINYHYDAGGSKMGDGSGGKAKSNKGQNKGTRENVSRYLFFDLYTMHFFILSMLAHRRRYLSRWKSNHSNVSGGGEGRRLQNSGGWWWLVAELMATSKT